jgi:hypothetical protein
VLQLKSSSFSFLVFFCLASISFADEIGSKHLRPENMGQDFKDNPPICYPVSSKPSAWVDQYKGTPQAGYYWGAVVSCDALSKTLKRKYQPTGGGITHARDRNRQLVIPEWYPVQIQPTVPSPGVNSTEGWKCIFAKPNADIPLNEFTCTINCCQLGDQTEVVTPAEEPPLPATVELDLPRYMTDGAGGERLEVPMFAIEIDKILYLPRLKYTATQICSEIETNGRPKYGPVAFFNEKSGYFRVNDNGKYSVYSNDGSDGAPINRFNIAQGEVRLVQRVVCKN